MDEICLECGTVVKYGSMYDHMFECTGDVEELEKEVEEYESIGAYFNDTVVVAGIKVRV